MADHIAAMHPEFKGESDIPFQSKSSSLKAENGIVVCPKDPGMGVEIDPDYIKKAKYALS